MGEFDLAYKALESYVEIITKGKARVEKSGQAGLDLDDDETAVLLAVEAIRIACRYGPDIAADKILNLGETLQKWLQKVAAHSVLGGDGDSDFQESTNGQALTFSNRFCASCSSGVSCYWLEPSHLRPQNL